MNYRALDLKKLKKRKINFRNYLTKNTKLKISDITRLSYDLQSGNYIENFKKIKKNRLNFDIFNKNMKNLTESINVKNPKTILDFGTGEGILIPYILKSNKNIKKMYACDISFNRLYYARSFLKKKLNSKELSKTFLFCNEDFRLPFKSNSIDVVFTNGVFENLSNKNMNILLLELLRVAKKRLVLNEPIKNNLTRLKNHQLNYRLNYFLKKNNINFIEYECHQIQKNRTKYTTRVIDKNKKLKNDDRLFLKDEKYPLVKKNGFFCSRSGRIFPILNEITIFRSLNDLNFI